MCVTLALAAVSTIASGIGTAASIGAANAKKANAQYQAKLEQKQLQQQQDAAATQSVMQEQGRVADFARIRSSALASIGASGLSENISYEQGIAPAGEQALRSDIGATRLNLAGQQSSLADQTRVSEFGSKIAGFNAGMSKVDAVASFMKDSMNAASFVQQGSAGTKRTPPAPRLALQ